MKNRRRNSAFLRDTLLLFVVVLYVVGLVIWTPIFLVWPRCYADMSFGETVATRWVLVRHIWTNLVRTAP